MLLERRLGSLFDALSDSNFLNPRKLFLCLAQPIDTGAYFEPIVKSNQNLNCIYINEDAKFDDKREKDLVLEVLRMLVKTTSKFCLSISGYELREHRLFSKMRYHHLVALRHGWSATQPQNF